MSQRNPKLIDLDFAPPTAGGAGEETQPSDIRSLMNQLQQTAYELRHRLSAVEDERDHLSVQVEALQTGKGKPEAPAASSAPAQNPNDPVRLQNLELSRMADGLRRALTESENRLQAAQSQIGSLRMARDSAQAQNRQLSQKLEAQESELADLQDRLDSQSTSPAAPTGGNVELAEALRAKSKAMAELTSMKVHLERSETEREAMAAQAVRAELELEAIRQESDARVEAARAEGGSSELDALRAENQELTARLEAQRLETIDLATRFQMTQEQIKNVSASLAEARLLAKAVRAESAAAPSPMANPAPAVPAASEPALSVPAEAEFIPFPTAEAQSTLREMRRCYQAYAKNPEDVSHLNELSCLAHTFADQAGRSGLKAISRFAFTLETVLQELYVYPEQINNPVLTTVVDAIEFLSATLKLRDLRQLRDPAELSICVVDDDSATCECILTALESVTVPALSFNDPVEALCSLASAKFDLIMLDVQMPGMDGFELCTSLRQQAHHADTPVLFVTGRAEPEIRARCILSGGNDFMTKPFLLCELGLKVLMLTAKAQLHMV